MQPVGPDGKRPRREPPVFYPTMADMRGSFEKYIESIEEDIEEFGIGRIVPPAGWTPRQEGYDNIDFTVDQPIKQVSAKPAPNNTPSCEKRRGSFSSRGFQRLIDAPLPLPYHSTRPVVKVSSARSSSSRSRCPSRTTSSPRRCSKKTSRPRLRSRTPRCVPTKKHDAFNKKPSHFFNPARFLRTLPARTPDVRLTHDPHTSPPQILEREFWKKVTYNPPTYCADVAGSLFDKSHWGWDVSRLDSLLSRTLKRKNITLKGVNSAYLYFGMWRSLFAWHTEDLDLYSVNYLHFGAPKFWYAIAPEDRERFEILAQGMVPEMWRACPEFLRHKELLISPTLLEQNGIPFTRMVQHPGEFVVTYPGSYHSGFNTGFNCAESCNFATEAWVEYGECAGSCECVPDSVKLDMSIFEDEENGVCKLVDEDDYTRVKRGRVGEPRRRPTGEEDVKVKREKEDAKKEKAQPGEKGGTPALPRLKVPTAGDKGVLVPEGWKRTVVKKSPKGARETTYKSPDGKPIRSRSELTRYLGSNPRCGATLRDFYFETKAEDLPPARLLAPGTPSPAASGGDDAKGKVKGSFGASSGRAALKVKNGGVSKPSSGAKRGSGSNASTPLNARDSLGGFLGLDSIRKTLKLEPNSNAGVKKSNSGGAARANASNAGAPKPPPSTKVGPAMSRNARANAVPVGDDTFRRWKSGGLLEGAIAKVMKRASGVGKSIRGSSLVLQVEQALGVGTGSLRSHGNQIQTMSKTISGRVR